MWMRICTPHTQTHKHPGTWISGSLGSTTHCIVQLSTLEEYHGLTWSHCSVNRSEAEAEAGPGDGDLLPPSDA